MPRSARTPTSSGHAIPHGLGGHINNVILCTLGPASLNATVIRKLDKRGVYLYRINLSHTPLQQLGDVIETIRRFSDTPICIDTEGAQVRCGRMESGATLAAGTRVHLRSDAVVGNGHTLSLTPGSVIANLAPGSLVAIDFNAVLLQVLDVAAECAEALVLNGGSIGSNKAVTISPAPVLPALSENDVAAIGIARQHGVRHAALSFASSRSDVEELRRIAGPDSHIISKIESPAGVTNLDQILAVSDAILIDRGDLSREVPLESIPLLQKAIIRKANGASTPVYVATNLLESMVTNPTPTRAEINDVMNTLIDGADGLVLAAETAVGAYPVEAVDMVLAVARQYRRSLDGFRLVDLLRNPISGPSVDPPVATRYPSEILASLPSVILEKEQLEELGHILSGAYAPLQGFLTRVELDRVLDQSRLTNGAIWPVPVILSVDRDLTEGLLPGHSAVLRRPTGEPTAILHIEDIGEIGTDRLPDDETSHRYAVGGRVECLAPPDPPTPRHLTPAQTRRIFSFRGWNRVVGLETVSQAGPEERTLIEQVLSNTSADGVLIQPLATNLDQRGLDQLIASYERLIAEGLDGIVGVGPTAPRATGIRWILLGAVVARNMGCTHFAVTPGRLALAGISSDDVAATFRGLPDLGIELVGGA